MTRYIALSLALIVSIAANAAPINKNTFSNFSIEHADKLDFKQTGSELIGNVKIKFGSFVLSSPRVLVSNSAKDYSPEVIRFVEGVELRSSDLDIDAQTIEINFKDSLFKAYGEPDVLSIWKDDKEGKTTVTSPYQEYNMDTGHAKAVSKDKPVLVENPKRTITAKNVELKNSAKKRRGKSIESINFQGDVILVEADKRVEADDLYYWVEGSMIKAEDNVKILAYTEESDPLYIFADMVNLELDKDLMLASMEDFNRAVYLYANDFVGRGRNAYIKRSNKKPKKAVLTGNAFAQFQDKAVEGEEIVFNIQKKTIKSLVGRPHTKIFKEKKTAKQ